MAAGNWTPELIERACGDDLFGEPGRHSGLLDWDALVSADPEVLIVAPCGFDVPRTLAHAFPAVEIDAYEEFIRCQSWTLDNDEPLSRFQPQWTPTVTPVAPTSQNV